MTEQDQQLQPTTHVYVVMSIVIALAVLAFTGMVGTIYLCRTTADPTLVQAAVKMIQTDPSSALAALQLLRTDAAVIAIVAGLTGTTLGLLGGMLGNTRTANKSNPQAEAIITKEVIETPDTTTTKTTTMPVAPAVVPPVPVSPLPVLVTNPATDPVQTEEAKT